MKNGAQTTRLTWLLGTAALVCVAVAPCADAAESLLLSEWLGRSGTQLLAVDFYSSSCVPCKKAMPEWKRLQDMYGDRGFRLTVVSVSDASFGCVALPGGVRPEHQVCDDDGLIHQRFVPTGELPRAFLWDWRGNLLADTRHVKEIEKAIKKYLKLAPVVVVDAKTPRGKPDASLEAMVTAELSRRRKLTVVRDEAKRKRLRKLQAESHGVRRSEGTQCTLGAELSANNLLEAVVHKRGQRRSLILTMTSVETGCVQGSVQVRYDKNAPEASVTDAVEKLLGALKKPSPQLPSHITVSSKVRRADEKIGQAVPVSAAPSGADETIGSTSSGDWLSSGSDEVVVTFEATPAEAIVMVDGELVCQGTAGGCSRNLVVGMHSVTMQGVGYVKRTEQLQVKKEMTVRWSLEENVGWLTVHSEPPGIEVTLDKLNIGLIGIDYFLVRVFV